MKANIAAIAAGVLIVGLILFEVFTFGKAFGRAECKQESQVKLQSVSVLVASVKEWETIDQLNRKTINKLQGQVAELLEVDAINRRTIKTWESNAGGIRQTLNKCMDELEHRVGQ